MMRCSIWRLPIPGDSCLLARPSRGPSSRRAIVDARGHLVESSFIYAVAEAVIEPVAAASRASTLFTHRYPHAHASTRPSHFDQFVRASPSLRRACTAPCCLGPRHAVRGGGSDPAWPESYSRVEKAPLAVLLHCKRNRQRELRPRRGGVARRLPAHTREHARICCTAGERYAGHRLRHRRSRCLQGLERSEIGRRTPEPTSSASRRMKSAKPLPVSGWFREALEQARLEKGTHEAGGDEGSIRRALRSSRPAGATLRWEI